MRGGTSSNAITGLTVTGNWGGDGFTLAFGLVEPSAAPEPSTAILLGSLLAVAGIWRLRRHSRR
jgi:hypothetical protein